MFCPGVSPACAARVQRRGRLPVKAVAGFTGSPPLYTSGLLGETTGQNKKSPRCCVWGLPMSLLLSLLLLLFPAHHQLKRGEGARRIE